MREQHWYQVVVVLGCLEYRQREYAISPSAAVRAVMQKNRLSLIDAASVWLLGRSGAPVVRGPMRCRLSRSKEVQA